MLMVSGMSKNFVAPDKEARGKVNCACAPSLLTVSINQREKIRGDHRAEQSSSLFKDLDSHNEPPGPISEFGAQDSK